MSSRRFFMEESLRADQTAMIRGSDARHIATVLRLAPGDDIVLFDGRGLSHAAKIRSVSPEAVEVLVVRTSSSPGEPPCQVIVAQAFLKEKKMDRLVRQLTEVGITRWIPFSAARSIPRPDARRLSARCERWRKIAREAVKQCRRGIIPVVEEAVSFQDILEMGRQCDVKLVFWEKASEPLHLLPLQEVKKILLVMGPEGGFTNTEIGMAVGSGFASVTLGPRILKAETATLAASVLVQYLFGDMGEAL